MNKRRSVLGSETVEELHEHKNLRVLKNYVGSFSSSVIDNTEETQNKVGMLFSANSNQRKVNPFVYIKFWRQLVYHLCCLALKFSRSPQI